MNRSRVARTDIAVAMLLRFNLKAIGIGRWGIRSVYTGVPCLLLPQTVGHIKSEIERLANPAIRGKQVPFDDLIKEVINEIKQILPPSRYEIGILYREEPGISAGQRVERAADLFISPFCGGMMLDMLKSFELPSGERRRR